LPQQVKRLSCLGRLLTIDAEWRVMVVSFPSLICITEPGLCFLPHSEGVFPRAAFLRLFVPALAWTA
jgi:hypothetical protein